MTYKDFIQKKYDDVKVDVEQRNKIREQYDALTKQFNDLKEQQRELQSIIPKEFLWK